MPERVLGPLVIVVVLAAGCSAGGASSSGTLPLHQVAEIALPGDTSRMDYASLDASRHRLYIAHLGTSQVIVVDTAAKRVISTLDHVADVHGVLAVPELDRVYATATGSNQVVTFDATDLYEVGRAPTGGSPDGLAYDPDTGTVFVSNEDGPTVTEIDAVTGGHRRDIAIGGEAGNSAYDPVSRHVFVDVQDHDVLAEIDPTTGAVVSRHPLSGCQHDHGLLIEPVHHRAFVACDGNAELLEIDLGTFARIAEVRTGADPDVLTVDAAAGRLYVLAETGTLTVLDITSSPARSLAVRPLASGAHSGTVDPVDHTLFVPIANANGHPVLRLFEPIGLR